MFFFAFKVQQHSKGQDYLLGELFFEEKFLFTPN